VDLPRPVYPEALELAWLRRAMDATGSDSPETACDRLARRVAALSDLFTVERRSGFEQYAADPIHWAAYGLFFFPQTYVRIRFVLAECAAIAGGPPLPDDGAVTVADLGAGSGAAGRAAIDWLQEAGVRRPLRWIAVDRHAAALGELATLAGRPGRGRRVRVQTVVADVRSWRPDKPADLVLAAFVVNELFEGASEEEFVRWLDRCVGMVRHGGWLVVVEPATRPSSVRLERARDRLLGRDDVSLLAPCPHRRPCPLLALGRPNAWCHDVRRWNAPLSLRWMNRRLHRDLSAVAYSFLAVRRSPPPPDEPDAFRGRLVGAVRPTAGRIASHLCASDGSTCPCEVLTRHLDRAEARRIVEEWERGDRVRLDDPTRLGNGALRGARMERLLGFAPAAGPGHSE